MDRLTVSIMDRLTVSIMDRLTVSWYADVGWIFTAVCMLNFHPSGVTGLFLHICMFLGFALCVCVCTCVCAWKRQVHVHVCVCVCVCAHVCACAWKGKRDFRSHTVMGVESETAGRYGHSVVFCQGNNSSLIYWNKTTWRCFKLTALCVCVCVCVCVCLHNQCKHCWMEGFE